MVKKKGEVQVIEGIYSTRTLNPDGTVQSFVVDDSKLFSHVQQVLADYAAGKIGVIDEPVESIETKPLKKPRAKPVKKKLNLAELEAMTKADLEQLGRQMGIEIDRRKKKDVLIAELLKLSAK